jgi:3-dehydroquinate synthase
MKTVNLNLGERSYPIFIGQGLIGDASLVAQYIAGPQVLIVSNTTVGPLYLQRARTAFAAHETETILLPDGEQYKRLETLNDIITCLLNYKFDRTCTLVALGGGVVGDITGFAAATYQRGVGYIQVPTTLLAQVDSSVGGKTAVNHVLGKNMIGAFHQPRCVVIDTDVLATLADRELRAGLAEVIKYGLIRDQEFFVWLESNMERLLGRDPQALAFAIERSCCNKAEVVAVDELESGIRAHLNLGHTFGHAIETGLGYGTWLHGEAVAAGICIAARMSQSSGWLTADELGHIEQLVARAGLPTKRPESLSPARMRELMTIDKKARAGHPKLVLLRAIGSAVVTSDYDESVLDASLEISPSARRSA